MILGTADLNVDGVRITVHLERDEDGHFRWIKADDRERMTRDRMSGWAAIVDLMQDQEDNVVRIRLPD